jgi:phage host-nuclease inhibitor protein Gam
MKENIQTLNIKGKNNTNLNTIVEVFNSYFSGVADTIHKQIKENCKNVKTKSINYTTYTCQWLLGVHSLIYKLKKLPAGKLKG